MPVVEDAAEALGTTYKGRAPGTLGTVGVYSFNGNKIITTSGGGMLVSSDRKLVAHAVKLATQARDPAPHYEHSEIGYNYRLSNVLAGIGRGQLAGLEERAKRGGATSTSTSGTSAICPASISCPSGRGAVTRGGSPRSRSTLRFGADREPSAPGAGAQNIEARPLWKPMHLQPVFGGCGGVGGAVAEALFERGLCLPSGSNLSEEDLGRVVEIVRDVHQRRASR